MASGDSIKKRLFFKDNFLNCGRDCFLRYFKFKNKLK